MHTWFINFRPETWMRRCSFVLLVVCCSLSLKAQLVNNERGKAFSDNPFFNEDFIKNNKIKKITGSFSVKRDMDLIRNQHEKTIYAFHPSGKIDFISTVNYLVGDTAITYYTYAGNRLQCQIKNDAGGYFSYCYVYDEEGQIAAIKYARTKNLHSSAFDFQQGKDVQVYTETYKNQRLGNQFHSTLSNSSGRPYLKEIRYYDPNGYLTAYQQNFTTTSDAIRESYTYNQRGLVAEKQVSVLPSGESSTEEYTYDAAGNLIEVLVTKNDELVAKKEFLYKSDTMMLDAMLVRDFKNQLIEITTYEYEFY